MNILKKLIWIPAAIVLILGATNKTYAWCDPGEVLCGSVIEGDSRYGHDDTQYYRVFSGGPSCYDTSNWRGKADVYRIDDSQFAAGSGNPFWITLDWNDNPNSTCDDLILVLLEDCNTTSCLGADPHALEFEDGLPGADGNGYWIVVDARCDHNATTKVNYTLRIYCEDFPLPVELMSFSGAANSNSVTLNWSTATENGNDRFEIERRESAENAEWMTVGVVDGAGTTAAAHNYSFTDNSVSVGGYVYQLSTVDVEGNRQIAGHVTVNVVQTTAPVAGEFELIGNYPNPFNPSTMIRFNLGEATDVTLSVFDVQGREVATLMSGTVSAGEHEVAFDGAGLASGVYFARLTSGVQSDMMKMILMK
ncbi:T9SS type A sorting domain-containing protein [bacterium]|nr:T9SS type A sorting domain-containing protein [bacterium]